LEAFTTKADLVEAGSGELALETNKKWGPQLELRPER